MLGAIIGAASSLAGGLLGRKSSEKAAAAEAARQDRWAERNIEMQEDFAKQGIRWKVKDAKAAGVHPLYALGANTVSFSPVSVGGVGHSDPLPGALADAGQNLGRAVSAMSTPSEKMAEGLQLENMALQNDLLRTQIASQAAMRVGTGPGFPGAMDLVGNPRTGALTFSGLPWVTNPNTSDAEVYENRYGDSEIMQTLIGMGIAAADAYRQLPTRESLVEWKSRQPRDAFGRYKFPNPY